MKNLVQLFEKGLFLLSSYTSVLNSIQAIALLENEKIDIAHLISHQLPLEDFAQGVEIIEKGVDGVLKVVIVPELAKNS